MEMYVLGTANGNYHSNCYNTCFCIKNDNQFFLVDGGGGNQILGRLASAQIKLTDIHDIFISHSHPDHILGIVWVLKKICGAIRKGKYDGDCRIYANDVTLKAIKNIRDLVFDAKNILEQIKFIEVKDKQVEKISGMNVEFFDTRATKAKQFGFSINHNFIVFCGDESLVENNFPRVKNCNWLLHNAFCLDVDEEKYHPNKMSHNTVGEASKIAQKICASNLVLWHTETDSLETRKIKYTQNAKQFFLGNIYVPNDMEVIELN